MLINPKPKGLAFGSEFEFFDPEKKYAGIEQPGLKDFKGSLPFIKAKSHIELPPLDPSLEKFLKNVWKAGVVNTSAPQRNFLGQQRVYVPEPANFVGPRKLPPLPARPAPAFAPLPSPSKNPLPGPMQSSAPHLAGVARDWKIMLDIERVVAYGFRGDTRDPDALKTAKGFQPPSTRTDDRYLYGAVFEQFKDFMQRRFQQDITLDEYKAALAKSMDTEAQKLFMEYSTWRAIIKGEEMHLGRMLANEALKGYISTTKAVTVAKAFGKGGWVYCLLVKGGYLVPDKGKMEWTKLFGEQEIAYPGGISWENVWGCRKVTAGAMFEGPVFLRAKFFKTDEKAAEKVFKYLSGKVQKATEDED